MTRQRSPDRETADDVDGAYAWGRLARSVVLAAVGSLGLWSYVVVLPTVQAEFGVDRGSAALPFTLTMTGLALGNALFGRLTDRWGVARPVIAAALLLCCGFVGTAMTSSIAAFAIVHGVLIGIGTASTFGPLIADISHWFRRRRGIAVAAVACGNYIAGTVAPPVLRAVADSDGWRTAYAAMGLFCLAVMVPLALTLRRRPAHALPGADASAGAPTRQIDLSPRALQALLIVAGLACCVAMSMPQVHIVAYCADLGYGAARGAEMLSLMLAAGIFSRLASGYLTDRIGGVHTMLLGSMGQGLALVLFLPFDGLVSLYVIAMLFGLAQGGIVPCYVIVVREYLPAREAGRRVGIIYTATIAGMAFGGWLTGWIYDVTGSYHAAFLNGIAWNVLHASIVLMILWRTRRPTGGPAVGLVGGVP